MGLNRWDPLLIQDCSGWPIFLRWLETCILGYGEKRIACCPILNTETSNRNTVDSPLWQPLANPLFSLVLTGTKTAGPSVVEPGSPSNRTPGISFQLEAGQLQDMGVKGLTWVRYTEAFEHWSFFFKNSLKMMQIYRMLSCTNLVQSCPGSASGTPHHPDWPPSTAEWKDSKSKSMSEKFECDNKAFSFNRSVHPLCWWCPHLSLWDTKIWHEKPKACFHLVRNHLLSLLLLGCYWGWILCWVFQCFFKVYFRSTSFVCVHRVDAHAHVERRVEN